MTPECTLEVRSDADLLAAIPYMFGFHLFRTTMFVDVLLSQMPRMTGSPRSVGPSAAARRSRLTSFFSASVRLT